MGIFEDIYDEKIKYIGSTGREKTILFNDVKAVYYVSMGNEMRICSDDVVIEAHTFFNGSVYIEELIKLFVPEAFDEASLLKIKKSKDFYVEENKLVFKIRKFMLVIATIFLLLFWGTVIPVSIVDSSPMPQNFIWAVLIWNIPLILLLLYSLVSRLYIDENGVTKRNLFGTIRQLKWNDIESVETRRRESNTLYGKNTNIKISANFSSYDLINSLIIKRCPQKAYRKRQ